MRPQSMGGEGVRKKDLIAAVMFVFIWIMTIPLSYFYSRETAASNVGGTCLLVAIVMICVPAYAYGDSMCGICETTEKVAQIPQVAPDTSMEMQAIASVGPMGAPQSLPPVRGISPQDPLPPISVPPTMGS